MTEKQEKKTERPIDSVVRSFDNRRRPIEIPKWGMTLWFGPLVQADLDAVEEREPKNRYERQVMLLIMKAELEDGSQAFVWGDKHTLMTKADVVILNTLFAHMYGAAIDLEELREKAGKESEKTAG